MDLPEILLVFISILLAFITVKLLRREKTLERRYTQLLTQNKRFVQANSFITHALCILDKEKRVAYMSPVMRTLLSIERDYVSLETILERFPNTFVLADHIETAIKNHTPSIEQAVLLGKTSVSIHVQPLIETAGRLNGVAIILKDEQSERSVTQMKEDFTKVISHELRSPLTTIKAASQFIRMQGDRAKEADREKLLRLIDEQSEKLLYEIELILDSAKLEGKEFTIKPAPNDLHSFLEQTLSPLIEEAEKQRIKILVQLPQHLSACQFDKKYLGQAIQHVLSNSIKFTNPGGQIVIQVREEKNVVSMTISDTGAGIPKEQHAALFSRFSHISRPSENIGIGLGLYLTKGIIEAHGGQISLSSEKGHGTSVSMSIPVILSSAENTQPFSLQN